MNKVILSGNLCQDVQLKVTTGGTDVVINCVDVKREFKNAKGENETDYINFVAYSNQANYLANYAKKGDRVELVGRWQTRTYQDQYGNNKVVNEVVVESITAFSNKPTDPAPASQEPIIVTDDNLPF